ncbi:MAG: hypothetical protein HUJ25_16375 [Crocinitomicaceae bacterium]|nr:hypothetical protein [Crocinitomicaceae bacterium]
MNAQSSPLRTILVLALPAAIILTLYSISKSAYFSKDPDTFSVAITIDMLVILPLVHFALVRKTKIPNITVVPVFIAAMLLVGKMLPGEYHDTLDLFKTWILPLVELAALSFVFVKIRQIRKAFANNPEMDFYTALKDATHQFLPSKVAVPFATEIAMFYYALIHWKSVKIREGEFTYHQNSGTPALLFALILIVGVELFAVHLLLVNSFPVLAWVFTGLSIYSAVQLLAFGKSLLKRPYKVLEDELVLHYGILGEAKIDYQQIIAIRAFEKEVDDQSHKRLSPLGKLDSYNVLIELKDELRFTGLYGIKRKADKLLVFVDDKEQFIAEVSKRMNG